MKKKLFAAILALSLTLPLAVFAAETLESTMSVESTANSEVMPDTVKINFYVENSGANLADIKDKNDKIVNAAIAEIKKKLSKDESVKTIAFRVNNIYSYKDKVRIFQKYEVVNGFEVKLKDMSKISDIINLAIAQGVKRVDDPQFSVENGQQICNELMAQAISMAKSRAQYLASTAGVTLDKPKSINPYCSLSNNFVQSRFYANSAKSMDSAGATEAIEAIEPGSISVRVSVNMIYYLK